MTTTAGSTSPICWYGQPGREAEVETIYREAITAGDASGWLGLGSLFSDQPGREDEAEAAYRAAIDGGWTEANLYLGLLLARDGARGVEAAAAFRAALGSDSGERSSHAAAVGLGQLLARRGDIPGARAAHELAARTIARAAEVEFSDARIAAFARIATALARRPRLARLVRRLTGPAMRRWCPSCDSFWA